MTAEYEALAALAEAATPGPWQSLVGRSWAGEVVVGTDGGHPIAVVSTATEDVAAQADAAFIAAANPTAVLALIADLRDAEFMAESWFATATERWHTITAEKSRADAAEAEVERLRRVLRTVPMYSEAGVAEAPEPGFAWVRAVDVQRALDGAES